MKIRFLIVVCLLAGTLRAQQIIPLYTGRVPNAKPSASTTIPTLTVFQPSRDKATGTAIIVCPGGGYSQLVLKREGYDVAQAFANLGVTAFVLTYRLPNDTTMVDKSIGPLQDAQQALKIVRERATEWAVNPAQIGLIGFSAGGHLAATAGTHFTSAYIDNPAGTSLRPDFMILVYPVISFADSLAHAGSRDRLLGLSPSADQIRLFSNERQVTPQTPPAFLLHATDDQRVSVGNSLRFYEALQRNGVPVGMHIYPKGMHGFSLSPAREDWFNQCQTWLKSSGWLKP